MEKEFIPYEQALALKELGFDESCFAYYSKITEYFRKYEINLDKLRFIWEDIDGIPISNNENLDYCKFTVPTFSQAFRWFREKYSINSWIINAEDNNNAFKSFFRGNNIDEHLVDFYNTYEEAELARLKKLIEIAKNK